MPKPEPAPAPTLASSWEGAGIRFSSKIFIVKEETLRTDKTYNWATTYNTCSECVVGIPGASKEGLMLPRVALECNHLSDFYDEGNDTKGRGTVAPCAGVIFVLRPSFTLLGSGVYRTDAEDGLLYGVFPDGDYSTVNFVKQVNHGSFDDTRYYVKGPVIEHISARAWDVSVRSARATVTSTLAYWFFNRIACYSPGHARLYSTIVDDIMDINLVSRRVTDGEHKRWSVLKEVSFLLMQNKTTSPIPSHARCSLCERKETTGDAFRHPVGKTPIGLADF